MKHRFTPRPIWSLFKRELSSYFTNPTAYIFITLFVFLSGIAAFWTQGFFLRNLANLDQLTGWFPVLLVFLVPAITMAAWADERKQGTDELLLTMPATEFQLAMGKYLGTLAIYTICLMFASSHVVVLAYLGRPDIGLLLATYFGYFCAGLGLLGLGLFASSLSASSTIAYITGAVICALLVSLNLLTNALPANLARFIAELSIPRRLEPFGRGVIELSSVAYFLIMALVGIYLTARLLRKRRRVGMPGQGEHAPIHALLRIASVLTIALCSVLILDRSGARADATAERLWSLSPTTRQIVRDIPPDQSIDIIAFLSKDVPSSLVQQREQVVGIIRELAATSAGKIRTSIVELSENTQAARDAQRSYGISSQPVPNDDGRLGSFQNVFMGLAVTSPNGDLASIPFLARGLAVEYELARSIRAVSSTARKNIGIVENQANLFGSFDFQTMQPRPDWPIIAELRKQYKVSRVNLSTGGVPTDVDVLLVAQPSILQDAEVKELVNYVQAGRPAIILEDPLPLVSPGLATNEPRQAQNPMMGQSAGSGPKANLQPLWDALGAKVNSDFIVWDNFNPRPTFEQTPGEFIWAAARPAIGFSPFASDNAIVAGLQEVVMLFAGRIERLEGAGAKDQGADFTTLIRSGPTSGSVPYAQTVTRNFLGMPSLNPQRRPARLGQSQPMAVLLSGGAANIKVLLAADIDFFSETFFALRERGTTDLVFDNVAFILNSVDALAGDTSLLELRKKRPIHRTLERIDNRRQAESEAMLKAEDLAREEAQSRLSEAQSRLEAAVKAVEAEQGLDDTARMIKLESVRRAEQSRLDSASASIEADRTARAEDARIESRENIEKIERSVRLAAVTLPPLPAIATGLFVLASRRRKAQQARVD